MRSDEMLARARAALTDLAEPTHSSNDGLLEVCAPGVSKATTLARLAGEWGISAREVVAFGDMPNDVPMLQWAGWGFAMAGAHPEAVAAAPHVTASVSDDGVAGWSRPSLAAAGSEVGPAGLLLHRDRCAVRAGAIAPGGSALRRISSSWARAAICWANSAVWMPWNSPSSQPTSWAWAIRSSASEGTLPSSNGRLSRSSSATSSGARPDSSSLIDRRWISRAGRDQPRPAGLCAPRRAAA